MGLTHRRKAAFLGIIVAVGGCAPGGFPGAGERLVIAHGDVVDRSELRVPPGHMPPVGQCRIWFPGRPPGHQPQPRSCSGLQRTAPAGSWILYRPTTDKKVVHARVIDSKRAGVVVSVRIYDVDRGTYLRDERPR